MEVETKRNNKIVPILIVIIVLLVCCVGVLGYKLYFSDNKDNVNNNKNQMNENTNQNQNSENSNQNQENTNIPVDNTEEDDEEDSFEAITLDSVKGILNGKLDSNVKRITPKVSESELKKNFKDLDKSSNNYKILASCIYYEKSEKRCDTYKVNVNSTIEYKISLPGCTSTGELYAYNNYLVLVVEEGCSGLTKVTIYDSNNKQVYSTNKAYSQIYEHSDEEGYPTGEVTTVKPTINEGKLYFAENIDTKGTMNLISIDLSKSTIKAKVRGQFTVYLTR